jgi:beta-aspartyl-peptidase (threonine type)
VAAIEVMEDSPLFNAGKGSNLTSAGTVAMDAAIMVGDTLEAGAVAGVRETRHPIRLARLVMERCPYVMLSGPGTDAFAREQGLELRDPSFFLTQRRWDDLQRARAREVAGGSWDPEARPNTVDLPGEGGERGPVASVEDPGSAEPEGDGGPGRTGTVGAVALGPSGRLVAGTSTGGSANKRWGRIGDSPVIGAGTYAGSQCGVSCTGWGEYFIRGAVAHEIQARIEHGGRSLTRACHEVVMEVLESRRAGLGGVIALDRTGHVEMCFNTLGMYRGWVDQRGHVRVAIYE